MTYQVLDGTICRVHTYVDFDGVRVDGVGFGSEPVCTVDQAVEAWLHMERGPAICKKSGHDYSIRVPQTTNMYTCFRCGEPGWEVPDVEA